MNMDKMRRQLPSKSILQKFDMLLKEKDSTRINTAKELVKIISTEQNRTEEGLCFEVEYTVGRLVQGLSSERKFAREGFSIALCHLLRSIETVDFKHVFNKIEEKAVSQLPPGASKKEERNVAVGKVMGLLALLRSQKARSSTDIEQALKELLDLYGQNTHTQMLCMGGVVQIVAMVKHKKFEKSVLPLILPHLSTGWQDCSPNTLHLLLIVNKYHPSCIEKLLKDHWQTEDLVSEDNFSKFADIVMKCTSCMYIIHPLIDQLIADVQEKQLSIVKFWKTVCRPLLVLEKRMKKHTLELHICQQLLPFLDSPKKVREVLPEVCSVLIQVTSRKTEDLGKKAQKMEDNQVKAKQLLSTLTEMTVNSASGKFQLEVLQCLIKPPGNYDFDKLTSTNTVSQISSQLVDEARSTYIEELIKSFTGQSKWILMETENQCMFQWCMKQLCHMCNMATPAEQMNILKFLFLHSFFTVKQSDSSIQHCEVLRSELTDFQRKSALDSFVKTLSKLLTKRDRGISKAKNLNKHIDLCYELGEYIQQLLQARNTVQLMKANFQEEIEAEWSKLREVVSTINKKRNKEEITDDHAFELLFLFYGFQMFIDTQSTRDSLQDLYVCYKKATKRRKSVAKDDGPAWIDVITEVLISLMSNENASSRVVARQVMSFLADHVTSDTVQLLVETLNQSSLDGEDGLVEGNEEHDSDEEDGDEEADEDEDEESSDDSGIEEENDLDVPEVLKMKVKAALGDAAGAEEDGDEEENEEDVEFSDTEMFKLDGVLAAAFKSMAKGKKGAKAKTRQLMDFKLRVLDLVEAIVKSQVSAEVTVGFIVPLLNLVKKGMKQADEENLGNKAQATLQILLKQKRVKADSAADKDALLELLNQLLDHFSKVPVPSFVQDVGNSTLFVLKILFGETGFSPVRTRSKGQEKKKSPSFYQEKAETVFRAAILDYLEHRKTQPAFFHILIMKYPLMFWSLSKDFTKTVQSKTTKVFERAQAAAFLGKMICRELHDGVDGDSWADFVSTWRSTATEVIDKMCSGGFKKNLLEEVVAVCHQIELVDPDKLCLDETVLRQLLTMTKKCDKSMKKAINRLTKHIAREMTGTVGKKVSKKRQLDKSDEPDGGSPAKLVKGQMESHAQETNLSENKKAQKKHKKKKNKQKDNDVDIAADQNKDQPAANVVVDIESLDEEDGYRDQNIADLSKANGTETPKSMKKKKKKRDSTDLIDTPGSRMTAKKTKIHS